MKNNLLAKISLTIILFCLLFFGCSVGGSRGEDGDNLGTNSGLFISIIGFNDELHVRDFEKMDSGSIYSLDSFINNLQQANGTLLYHAANKGLNKIEDSSFPEDLSNIATVIFTDGLDIGSYIMNDEYNSGSEYLDGIHSRIDGEEYHGLPLNSYAIGIRGVDVTDVNQFTTNLQKLSSTNKNYEAADMSAVQSAFNEVVSSLYSESSSQSLDITMPAPEPGALVRITFDSITSADSSTVYIEGKFEFNGSSVSLTDVVYTGMTCDEGDIVYGSLSGININLSFKNIVLNSNIVIDSNLMKQWAKLNESSPWQINSEFIPSENIQTIIERDSAAVVLMLDCSSSLGDELSNIKIYAMDFVESLYNNYFSN